MDKPQEQTYYKAYIAGYQDGLKDAAAGKAPDPEAYEIVNLPIKAMALSTRAYNCLFRTGCTHVADVIALSEYSIMTMRNLGPKTAREIARWLDEHGICCSVWNQYL